ncbi:E3 ubiquitin-protein ligase RNF187 [Mirounga leonina]|uniref:E3 ubiquitin-protein ligase RNF187 n=1 Tax=Mirounga leonina TaxID=9715 RepID=UPI00156C0645|nr:E3 ubiquitin-protein ligase RNF187 [Mirounga leonina]
MSCRIVISDWEEKPWGPWLWVSRFTFSPPPPGSSSRRVIYGASDNPGKIAGCEAVGRPADGSVRGTAARTFRGELPGQDPGRVARAHPCQDLVRAAPLPGSKSVKHTSARTLRGAHRCQDPAWGAPPSPPRASPSPSLSPASALRPSPLSSASRARLARTPWSPSLRRVLGLARPPAAPSPRAPAAAALALPAGPAEAACALCQRAPREPVRADCGHRFCRACVVRFWAEEDGPFPCPECADDCWQRAVEPGRPPLSRRLLALEEAAAAPARDGPASEAALQLLCRADGGPLCAACRMAAGPEPPEWEPRWRKALRGKENKGSVEIMRKDLNDARDLHGQAESAAAVWKGHVMDRRKKALTDYKKLRAFFAEEEERFLQEADKEEGSPEDEDADPAERFGSLLQAVSELERRHRNLGLSMLLQ